jgi:methyl-accepting chemotaxis protein
VDRLGELQTALTGHLTSLGLALEDPITRLIHTASEAPRAAAEVIAKLRQEMSSSVARDNELLEERSRIMATLNSLLDSINHASVEQRAVIDALVASSAVALQAASQQFAQNVGIEAGKLSDIAANVTSSAVEVSSLSETLNFAVRSFGDANEKLISNLQRIEGAMDKSMARSDEQLAYYVAQAREVIDLSVMSQKEIFEELRQLPGRQQLAAEEAV